MSDEPATTPTTVVEHATCLACGCLCDDIRVEVEGGRIVEAGHSCAIGRRWFLSARPGVGRPIAAIDGLAAPLEAALDRAAEILRVAKAPVVWGLAGTTIEAAREALAIADQIGAVVEVASPETAGARLAAFQRVGLVSASLGEVKDRADLVVFWGADPLTTHPRHWERYSVAPPGRFIPEGRAGRFVVVVDSSATPTSQLADLFVTVEFDRQAETIEVLRALVRGVAIDPERAGRFSGVEFSKLNALADRLQAAHYGALFFGPSTEARAFEPLFRLVRDLNEGRRFVALELGEPGNPSGASSVLAWQAGASSSVDYGLGHPRHLPGEATLAAMLARGEVDAVLAVADDPADALRITDAPSLFQVPMIHIAPGATIGDRSPAVAFDVARPSLETGGTVARVDGVMLPLRPAIASGLPTDREILRELRSRLERDG